MHVTHPLKKLSAFFFTIVLAVSVTVSCPCCITATDVAAFTFSPWARPLAVTQGRLIRMRVGWVFIIDEAMLLLMGCFPFHSGWSSQQAVVHRLISTVSSVVPRSRYSQLCSYANVCVLVLLHLDFVGRIVSLEEAVWVEFVKRFTGLVGWYTVLYYAYIYTVILGVKNFL